MNYSPQQKRVQDEFCPTEKNACPNTVIYLVLVYQSGSKLLDIFHSICLFSFCIGGLKVWDGSMDLLRFISERAVPFTDLKVLEVCILCYVCNIFIHYDVQIVFLNWLRLE